MKILMPDGTEFDPKKETPMSMMDPDHPARAVATTNNQAPRAVAAVVETATPPRTVVTVSTELERAMADHAEHAKATADSLARIKSLTAELRGFVMKKRAAKGTP